MGQFFPTGQPRLAHVPPERPRGASDLLAKLPAALSVGGWRDSGSMKDSSRPHTRRGLRRSRVRRIRDYPPLRSGLEGRGLHERLEAMRNGWSWFATFASAGDLHERALALLQRRGPFDGSDDVWA